VSNEANTGQPDGAPRDRALIRAVSRLVGGAVARRNCHKPRLGEALKQVEFVVAEGSSAPPTPSGAAGSPATVILSPY